MKQEQRQLESTKQGVKYLKIIQDQFSFFQSSNLSKMARSKLAGTADLQAIREAENDTISRHSNEKHYWISTNFDTFMSRLNQDEEDKRKKDQMDEEKKRRVIKTVSSSGANS